MDPRLSLPELRGLYQPLKLIGKGASGLVYKATRDGTVYAVKRLLQTVPPDTVRMEVLLLRLLGDQPHVVALKDAFRSGCQVSLVLSYCENEDFERFFRDMNAVEVRNYMRQLLQALCHLHAHGVVHRDVKPPNFLFDPMKGEGLLIDLGLAEVMLDFQPVLPPCKAALFFELLKAQRSRKTQVRGTRGFLAPECLLEADAVTGAADVWAAGVIFLSFLSKRYPFFHFSSTLRQADFQLQGLLQLAAVWGSREVADFAEQSGWQLDLPESLPAHKISWQTLCPSVTDSTALELLDLMLCLRPEKRITALDALSHAYFCPDA